MKPYYEDELVTLFHGDCLELTDWLQADVLVTDPPYGMAYRDRQGASVVGDHDSSLRDVALTAWGATRPAVVFGTWKVERPTGTKQVLIWDKWGGGGTVGTAWSPWAYSHEEVYLLGTWPQTVPGGRLREGGRPSRHSGVLRAANYNTQSSARPEHPTPKPVALMESILALSPPGTVADPFAGSGSTLIAARNLGRRGVGVEIEERYCELVAKRLGQQAFDLEGIA
jgi:DNA modification methylase